MEIKNFTQFYNFINNYQLINEFQELNGIHTCISQYSRMCNCGGKSDKHIQYNKCNALYINIVNTVVKNNKDKFLRHVDDRKLVFYFEEFHYIATIT